MIRMKSVASTMLVIAACAMTVEAADQSSAAKPVVSKTKPAVTAQRPGTAAGVVIAKDPVTGELRQATAEEIGALSDDGGVSGGSAAGSGNRAAAFRAPEAARPQVVHRADGMDSLMLGAEQASYSVITKTADGKLVEDCVTGEAAAQKALTEGVRLAPARKAVRDEK